MIKPKVGIKMSESLVFSCAKILVSLAVLERLVPTHFLKYCFTYIGRRHTCYFNLTSSAIDNVCSELTISNITVTDHNIMQC